MLTWKRKTEIDSLQTYISHVDKLCNSVEIRDWTGYRQFKGSVTDCFRHLENSAGILTDIIGVKRGEPRPEAGGFELFGGGKQNTFWYFR